MCTHPFAKKALTLHLVRSEGHESYFGCNLMHCKVLASSHQHLMAEAPTGRERGSTGSRSEQYDVQAISYGLGRISYLLLSSEARPHRTRTGMEQGYVLVSHSGTHLFHRIEATQSKARRQIVSDMTPEEMQKELERLQAENETLKKRSERELSLKVSQKGGVSVYGLGRFPVTLYKEQWEKLLEMTDDIRAFIQENKAQLKTKDS